MRPGGGRCQRSQTGGANEPISDHCAHGYGHGYSRSFRYIETRVSTGAGHRGSVERLAPGNGEAEDYHSRGMEAEAERYAASGFRRCKSEQANFQSKTRHRREKRLRFTIMTTDTTRDIPPRQPYAWFKLLRRNA